MDLLLKLVPCGLTVSWEFCGSQLPWADQKLSFIKLFHLAPGDLPAEENSRKPTQTIGNGAKTRTLWGNICIKCWVCGCQLHPLGSALKPIHVELPLTLIRVLILTSCVLNVVLMQFDLIFNGSNLINGSVNKKVKLWPPTRTDTHSKQL